MTRQQTPGQHPGNDIDPLLAVAVMFAELGHQLAAPTSGSVLDALAQTAVGQVRGADAASITIYRNEQFVTVAASDERARGADALQYELGSGPCVDAILDNSLYQPVDLCTDARWPEYGRRVSTEWGWVSMLSFRLNTSLMDDDIAVGLNIYASRPSAFDAQAVQMGLLLATHGALAVAAQASTERARNLERALETSREIGVAIGVVMTRHGLSRAQAFDLLRIASQHSNRKLAEVAIEVVDAGDLAPEHLGARAPRDR